MTSFSKIDSHRPTYSCYPDLSNLESGPSAPPLNSGVYHVEATVVEEEEWGTHLPSRQRSFLTPEIHSKTEALLQEMETVANKALGQKASASVERSSPSRGAFSSVSYAPVNIDFSNRSWNWGNRTEVRHHGRTDTKGSDSSSDTSTRLLVGAIGLIGAGIASYFIGKTCAQGEDAKRANSTYEELKGSWKYFKETYQLAEQFSVDSLIKKTDYLKGREKANRIQKLALYTLMFIAGAAAVTAAIVRSRFLVRSAVVIGAFTLIAALFKYGYSSFSKGHLDEARKIKQEVTSLRLNFQNTYQPHQLRFL